MPEDCASCGKKATHACSLCHAVKYCSQDCQRAHWKVHKKTCKRQDKNPEEKSLGSSIARVTHDKWLLCGSRFWLKLQRSRPMSAPVVGLQNQGNTCYLNAILQCIVHTPLLYWSLQELPSDCLEREDTRWLAELKQLLEDMSEAENRGRMAISSKMSELITVNKEFTQGQQADAHEAFMFIIERLLDACLAVGDGKSDSSVAEAARSSPATKETLERNSLMGFLFGMDLQQTLRCRSCSYRSKKSHAEYCVYLRAAMGLEDEDDDSLRPSMGYGYGYGGYDLPYYSHRRSSSLGAGNRRTSAIPETSLRELFEAYTRVEEIDGYKCEKCNSRLGCEQSSHIKNPPNILVVYISRQKDTNRFGKIKRHVEFPQQFDLSPFVEADQRHKGNLTYRLYGVVVHKDVNNSTFFGHYIAYVKTDGRWRIMDDASVSACTWATVQDQQADLLFYAANEVDPPPLQFEPKRPANGVNGAVNGSEAGTTQHPSDASAARVNGASSSSTLMSAPPATAVSAAPVEAARVNEISSSSTLRSAEQESPATHLAVEAAISETTAEPARSAEPPFPELSTSSPPSPPVAEAQRQGEPEETAEDGWVVVTKAADADGGGAGGIFDWDELDLLEAQEH